MSPLHPPMILPVAAALPWLQQALVYVHLFAFAITIAQVIRFDLVWLRTRDLDASAFAITARIVMIGLLVLWTTGLALIGLSTGLDVQALLDRPKLVAKLIVVAALTLNGLALHRFALPRLGRGRPLPAWTLGAISTTSWTAAALIGAARHVAPSLALSDYLTGYAVALVTAVTGAWALAAWPAGGQACGQSFSPPGALPTRRAGDTSGS